MPACSAQARRTRIIDVIYNASNNELVRTKTLVKNCIVQIDAGPFRQWYEAHYATPLGRKKGTKLVRAIILLIYTLGCCRTQSRCAYAITSYDCSRQLNPCWYNIFVFLGSFGLGFFPSLFVGRMMTQLPQRRHFVVMTNTLPPVTRFFVIVTLTALSNLYKILLILWYLVCDINERKCFFIRHTSLCKGIPVVPPVGILLGRCQAMA